MIRSQNVYNDRFSKDGLVYISEHQAAALANVNVECGDVLVNITGDSVARACQVNSEVLPARVNQHVAIIRPDPEVIDPGYLRYWLITEQTQNHLLALASAGATRPALTKGMLETLSFPDVNIASQRAIARTLAALDNKIELNRQMNETLEASARALFRDWFVDFGPTKAKMAGDAPYLAPDLWSLFPHRLDDNGVPEGWATGALKDTTELQSGFAFKSKDWRDSGIPVIKIGSVKPQMVDMSQVSYVAKEIAEASSRFELCPGDMVVGMTGYVGETGRIPPTSHRPLLNQRVGRFKPKKHFSSYVFACVRGEQFKNFAISKAHGSAQPNVSAKSLLECPVIIPSEGVLKDFDALTSKYWQLSLANMANNHTLAQTRDLLLPKLISGEIRVGDAEQAVSKAV
ncbi:restriction endonuclease subunit S [Salinisphaera shabanensis]|uniref:restriction endonuclease subunit S n=1 Tax=Salinisphaera shabanensis TaxID=180542 RepID=UPI001930A82E|nr:restriction endonuclease subunit S [Salinisphaera shabanensis]